jgi:pyrroline-5-carboxylate reductase
MTDASEALPPLLLVGGGRMGGALLTGWRDRGLAQAIVIDPAPEAAKLGGPGISVLPSYAAIPPGFTPSAVILAVKPQAAAETLPAYARFAGRAVFISIMAGQTIRAIERMLGTNATVVRAMPNTPAAIGQGVTVAVADHQCSPRQKALAETLLSATGSFAWVEQEDLLDPVTAVSGSGPAYVFLLAELLEKAGIEQGLPPDLARLLARRTITGAGALLEVSPEDAAELRRAVTSPKGTTEAALAVLMAAENWPKALSDAVLAATERSRELAG